MFGKQLSIAGAVASILTCASPMTAAPATVAAQVSVPKPGPGKGEQIQAQFEKCIAANVKTEFDRPADVLSRIGPACDISGTARIRGKGDVMYHDSLFYDPEKQVLSWIIPFTEMNGIGGASFSAYGLWPYSQYPDLSRHDRSILQDMGDAHFLLLPVIPFKDSKVSAYNAQNAYGAAAKVAAVNATAYSIATPNESWLMKAVPIVSFQLAADRAQDLVPNLDIEFDWKTYQPCPVCLEGGRDERRSAPTFQSPIDVVLTHRYMVAHILQVRLVDRRTGAVVATQAPVIKLD